MHVSGPISKLTRAEKLLAGLDVANMSGLEIGALASPMLRPPEARIKFVDHTDSAALRAKYANDPYVNVDDIVHVDAVWGDNTLAQCFPSERFDYVIASHVIEHVPDMIGWLRQVADILSPGGRLILAIPDRRYTFDLMRRETTLTDLIDAHLRGAERPTPGQVFDVNANGVVHDHMMAWYAPPAAPPPPYVTREWALTLARQAQAGTYIDGHCSVFTARCLLELLDGLLELDLLPFSVDCFHVADVGTAEMSLVLRRQNEGADRDASRATIRAMLQAGEDTEGLALDSPPPPRAKRPANGRAALPDRRTGARTRNDACQHVLEDHAPIPRYGWPTQGKPAKALMRFCRNSWPRLSPQPRLPA